MATKALARKLAALCYRVLRYGLTAVCSMAHRGAMDADAKTGDGSGVMTQIPYKLLRKEVAKLGHALYNDTDLGVGFVFLPHDNAYAQARAKAIIEEILEQRELFQVVGQRTVFDALSQTCKCEPIAELFHDQSNLPNIHTLASDSPHEKFPVRCLQLRRLEGDGEHLHVRILCHALRDFAGGSENHNVF